MSTSADTVTTEVVSIFREVAFLPADAAVDLDLDLVEHQDWDSIRQLDLILRIEQRLGIRFEFRDGELAVYRPDGNRLLSFQELNDRAESAEAEVERLMARLRAAGIDPDAAGS